MPTKSTVHDPWKEVIKEEEKLRKVAESKLGYPHIEVRVEKPPEGMGDLSFAAYQYAAHVKRPPEEIAAELAGAMGAGELIGEHRAVRGYLNSFLNLENFSHLVLSTILERKKDYGSHLGKPETIILEHTSVNPTGPVHVGRARNPIIGDALSRVLTRAGYKVTREYLVNDVGKQVIMLVWGVKNIPEKEVQLPETQKEDHRLVKFYQRAAELIERDPHLEKDIEEMVLRFERGDEALTKKVREICQRVLGGMVQSLERIDVRFDNFFWESQMILDGSVHKVMEKLSASQYCGEEDGAFYLDLEPFGVKGLDSRFFFTRRDGTTLYTTRDLAYHLNKFERCDRAINILGEDQKLGMQQLELALKIMNVGRGPESIFYAFVSLPEGRMSTRKGRVVYLDDLVEEAIERAYQEVKKRREDLSEEEMRRIAEAVGVGALKYNILRVQAEKKIVFRWEEALNFEGNSAPFLQYAHARACGILQKSQGYNKWAPSLLKDPNEIRLMKVLAMFPSVVEECAESRRVHQMASYAYEIASLFNQFYRDCPVLSSPEDVRAARLALVDSTRIVLENALDCMGIKAPSEM